MILDCTDTEPTELPPRVTTEHLLVLCRLSWTDTGATLTRSYPVRKQTVAVGTQTVAVVPSQQVSGFLAVGDCF